MTPCLPRDTIKVETIERLDHKWIPFVELGGALGLERGHEPVHIPGTSVAVERRITGAPDHVV